MFYHPVAVQSVVIEKAECANRLIEPAHETLFPLHQVQLILADVLRSEPIRRGAKMPREISDAADVSLNRVGE
jgi:hypothetical protein